MIEYLNSRKEELLKQQEDIYKQHQQAQQAVKETTNILLQISGAINEIDLLIKSESNKETSDK